MKCRGGQSLVPKSPKKQRTPRAGPSTNMSSAIRIAAAVRLPLCPFPSQSSIRGENQIEHADDTRKTDRQGQSEWQDYFICFLVPGSVRSKLDCLS